MYYSLSGLPAGHRRLFYSTGIFCGNRIAYCGCRIAGRYDNTGTNFRISLCNPFRVGNAVACFDDGKTDFSRGSDSNSGIDRGTCADFRTGT